MFVLKEIKLREQNLKKEKNQTAKLPFNIQHGKKKVHFFVWGNKSSLIIFLNFCKFPRGNLNMFYV